MDIFDSFSKYWSEFTHWAGFEKSEKPLPPPEEKPTKKPDCQPSEDRDPIAKRFGEGASRLQELAKTEHGGDPLRSRRFQASARCYLRADGGGDGVKKIG